MPGRPPDNPDPASGVPDRMAELIVRYYDADLSDQEAAELRAGLEQSAAAREAFVRWGLQRQSLAEALSPQYTEADAGAPLDQLAAMEDRAEAELVDLDELSSQIVQAVSHQDEDAGSLSAHEMVSVGGYLLRRALVSRFAIGGAVAALLLLGAWLFVPRGSDPAAPAGPAVTEWIEPSQPVEVAYLTNQRGAQWAWDGLSDGDVLHAGQVLELTGGFAEITTNRGAVVILEAPCSVELIDHSNAIRLHRGKLVGICETESSQGFLVRTPHMDVVDLGTRFGVDASDTATEVHVYDGAVRVEHDLHQDAPMRLVKGQALRGGTGADQVTRMAADNSLFAATAPVKAALHGTGTGLAVGETDPAWVVVAENDEAVEPPLALSVSKASGHIRFLPNDPERSQWLAWKPKTAPAEQPRYRIRTSIQVPDHVDPATAYLTLQCAFDNQLAGILVNGKRLDFQAPEPRRDWNSLRPLEVRPGLVAGVNTIEFEIINFKPHENHGGYEAGLRVEWQLHGEPQLFRR